MRFLLAILYYVLVFGGMCVIGVPYIIYKGYICKKKNEITRICLFYLPKVHRLFGIDIVVEGVENIPQKNGFVMVANHSSFMDISVLWLAISTTIFIAKAALWKAPLFGWVLSSIGCIPVHQNPRKNAGMGNMVQDRLNQGHNLSVFPEGHRSIDGKMLKFQNGIFRMAKEHHFPILPITLIGVNERLPKVKWAIYPGQIKVVVHPLIKPEDYAEKPMAILRDEVHDLIESALPYMQAETACVNEAQKEA
ncbi:MULTISPECIES: 1-acyl-sn-glycerol-3-phosphate acyltransferase [unclassified Fibrobacter]|uniref:lysophospholipid acyltransferase family protein n=1 Tax=unclassified Fibrobacter TaxID=2634177 RepID=UPI000D6B5809|nr:MULTISPECIES: lysophospholipid acyltransferase family protein [unclassified Fibrobacter]PWJ68110.1 1-acyl-sn-glycerol-3-phosphate acyltransferase [Fibrobacter sp. UWR4]PZW71845.1 1-acyl-sn-glycerol-3-phosphate acyltransferase [Fibrobacter sp. UWR1]